MSLSNASGPWIQCLEGIINPRAELHRMCLEAERLARCCPLDNSQNHCHGAPIFSETLPLELRNLILAQLDIRSLTNLRCVSQSSRLAVDEIPQYGTIRAQAPELLRAVFSHGIARWTLIEDLFNALISQTCTLCGNFAPFIYLLSCNRACEVCVSHDPQFCAQLASSAKAKSVDDRALASPPTLRSTPGSSIHRQHTHLEQLALFDWKAANLLAVAMRNKAKEIENTLGSRLYPRANRDKAMPRSQRIVEEKNDQVDNPVHPRLKTTNDTQVPRLVGIIHVPWLNRVSGKLEWGVSCKGCERGLGTSTQGMSHSSSRVRMYSQDDFLKHLECCTAGLPNERWPKSLAEIMTGSKSIEATSQWKANGNFRFLDPCFLNDTVALILKVYRRS